MLEVLVDKDHGFLLALVGAEVRLVLGRRILDQVLFPQIVKPWWPDEDASLSLVAYLRFEEDAEIANVWRKGDVPFCFLRHTKSRERLTKLIAWP